ncbi:hypothetical protein STEG23_036199 [Scotinomys teguina]
MNSDSFTDISKQSAVASTGAAQTQATQLTLMVQQPIHKELTRRGYKALRTVWNRNDSQLLVAKENGRKAGFLCMLTGPVLTGSHNGPSLTGRVKD